jgi:general transcription factor 3C polypeptide 3 (transcription factor C subunit 4)
LQGTGEQKWRDAVEDDREFDGNGAVPREGELRGGGYELDVNTRQRLAVARIKMGEVEEGKVSFALHCSIIISIE